MNKEQIQAILSVSSVFASPKRLMILQFLSKEPLGYSMIKSSFDDVKVIVGSSEIYKHVKSLKDNGFISKERYGSWTITKKGMVALDSIKRIADAESKVPKIRMEF